MTGSTKSVLGRIARGAVSLVLSGLLVKFADNPIFLVAQPFLSGIGKWLRNKGINNVPF